MGRKPRVEYAGAIYHVMCRGNRREKIFQDETDHRIFLETLAEGCERTGWDVCAYVLMPNHYHMVFQTPEANLVAGMKWFQGTYTKRHNLRHKQWGHVFQGRYKAVVIDPSDTVYFRTACNYVHLNPIRAKLVETDNTPRLEDYPWSSSWYLDRPLSQTPEWLSVGRVVEESLSRPDHRHSRKRYLAYLKAEAAEEDKEIEYSSLRRGWFLGGSEYKSELKEDICEHLSRLDRDSFVGEPRRMHDEAEAERLLGLAVGVVKLDLAEKDSLRKNDSRKEVVAWLLSKKTSVNQNWISNQLAMGVSTNVSIAIKKVEQTKFREVKGWKAELIKIL